jgi:hypothetical protein
MTQEKRPRGRPRMGKEAAVLLSVRIPPETFLILEKESARNKISLANYVRCLLECHITALKN